MKSAYAALFGMLMMLLSGCASVSVTKVNQVKGITPQAKPKAVYIADFDTSKGVFRVDREGEELLAFKNELATFLTQVMVKRMSERVAPASEFKQGDKLPKSGWLVKGSFTRVNQGSRALRAGIGFGLGGTKVETRVEFYDLALSHTRPFIRFGTTGGSNAEPGAVTSTTVYGVGAGLLVGAMKGLSEDTSRTARMITAMGSQYLYDRKWIKKDQLLPVKIEGEMGEVIAFDRMDEITDEIFSSDEESTKKPVKKAAPTPVQEKPSYMSK